jgi:hypothetical protein
MGREGTKPSISGKNPDRSLENESRNKPGPGAYNNNSALTMKTLPSYGIGTAKRSETMTKERQYSPDPTSYAPDVSFTKT